MSPRPGRPRALLVDIDGVLVVSWRAIEGAAEAMDRLRRGQVPLRLITNTTSRSRASIASALNDTGITVDEHDILTAPVATAAYLRAHHPGARCLLLSSGEIRPELEGVEVALVGEVPESEAVDVVILGGAGPEFSYEAISEVFDRVMAGTPLVAMHRNISWRTDRGLQLDTGAFVSAIERAAGIQAVVVGKPDPAFFATALDELGVTADQAAMVGDDIDADVLGAQAVGITGVLVRTGKFRPEQLERADGTPDAVVDSIATVPELFGLA
jgi:HAD superfamily hydrolase (TIGR01458 family)